MTTHLLIPDTQAKPGVPTDHLRWIGQYIVEKKPDVVIHIGDHPDMPSLSSYDRGKIQFEGRRYHADIEAANEAWAILNKPLVDYNATRARFKEKQWWPRRIYCRGNHDDRIMRAVADNPVLDGTIGYDDLDIERSGWEVYDFLTPVWVDGVAYCHFFQNRMTGKPLGGMAATRLKTIGHSFTMGHQQTLDYAIRFVDGAEGDRSQHALIAGACYLHDEDYKGVQGNAHWRGIVRCHGVEDGSYDPMFVRLDSLCRRYEGVPLAEFMAGR